MSGEISITSTGSEMFDRVCNLYVSDKVGNAVDLSGLRIKFSIKRSDATTPNVADIVVYNLSDETVAKLSNTKEFTRVVLQAGYTANFGVIFQGNIKQLIRGRESGQDTFINILAGDGERAYNYSIVNSTLAAGSTQNDQVTHILNAMGEKGVSKGYVGDINSTKLPRGKVMYGESKKFLRKIAQTSSQTISIQDEALSILPKKSYTPGDAVVLTAKTGMIGTPQQTVDGIMVKSLLNPMYKIAGRVFLNNKSIEKYKLNLNVVGSAANIPASIDADGYYYILAAEHEGDTRGQPWYSSLTCLAIDPSSNYLNSVQVDYHG